MAVLQFIVNKGVWEKLGPEGQTALEVWYSSAYDAMRREADLQDRQIAAAQKAGDDITVIDWSLEERAKFREIAVGAWNDFADKSPLAKEALDAHMSYMQSIGLLK
jgi:TRAP-type C4-dicarboxylate transport system substrate-binding protein